MNYYNKFDVLTFIWLDILVNLMFLTTIITKNDVLTTMLTINDVFNSSHNKFDVLTL